MSAGDLVCSSSLTGSSSSDSSTGSVLAIFFRFLVFVDLARFLSSVTDLARHLEDLHLLVLHIFEDSLKYLLNILTQF